MKDNYSLNNMKKFCSEFNLCITKYENHNYVRWNELKGKYNISKEVSHKVSKYIKYIPFGDIKINTSSDDSSEDEDICEPAVSLKNIWKYILPKCKSHPEHLNGLNIAYPNKDNLSKFVKRPEILLLSWIYKKYRNSYIIKYQFPLLNYRIDSLIRFERLPDSNEDENFGVVIDLAIEVDENNHIHYNSDKEEIRQSIIDSLGYSLVRINPNKAEEDKVLMYIEAAIKEQRLKSSSSLDIEEVEKRLMMKNVSSDFIQMIKPCIYSLGECGQYKIRMEDIMKYLGYTRNDRFMSDIVRKYLQEGVNYCIYNEEEVNNLLPGRPGSKSEQLPLKKHGGHNKQYVFMTMREFYEVCMVSSKDKSRELRGWFLDVYEICFQLIYHIKQKLIKNTEKQIDNNRKLAENMEKKIKIKAVEEKNKTKLEINKYKKELEQINLLVSQLKEENEQLKFENKRKDEIIKNIKEQSNHKDSADEVISKIKKLLLKDLKKLCSETKVFKGYSSLSKDELQKLIITTLEKDEDIKNKLERYFSS